MYLCFCIHVPRSMCLLIYSSVHVQKILMCLSTLVKRTLLRPVSSHKCSNTVFNLQSWTIFPTNTTKKHRCVIFNMYTCIPVCWVQPIWKIWVGLDYWIISPISMVNTCFFLPLGWLVTPTLAAVLYAASELDRLHTAWSNLSVCFGGMTSQTGEREAFFFAKKML